LGALPGGWLEKSTVVEFAKYAAYVAWKLGDLDDMWSTMNEANALYTASYVNVKSGFPPGIPGLDLAAAAARNMAEAHARAYEAIKEFSDKPVGLIHVVARFEPLERASRRPRATGPSAPPEPSRSRGGPVAI
jgi:beta-galactosidase